METSPGAALPSEATAAQSAAPATPAPESSAGTAAPPRGSFGGWLAGVRTTYVALVAAATALLGLFAPDRLVPEPLAGLRGAATLMAVLSFALTWAWRDALRRHLRPLTLLALLLAAALALLNTNFVEPVEYPRNGTRYFLVGPTAQDPEFRLAEPAEIIMQEGGSRATLRRVYGTGFSLVYTAYTVCYVLLLPAAVLAIGGTQLGAQRKTPRKSRRKARRS